MTRQTSRLRLLVVDDDPDFRESLVRLLEHGGHSVAAAGDLAEAQQALQEGAFDAVLADEELPDGRGSQLIGDPVLARGAEIVLITGHATVSQAVEAVRRGAADYLTKPTDWALLQATLSRLARVRELKREVAGLRDALLERGRFGDIVGRSKAMQPVFEMIQRVAPTDAGVLIQGESGTGKEVVARMLHALSRRREAPLITLNCGAIPESLMESELFGHEKGSFTGAERQHRGFFERADGGTLFLDEITEMPLQLQPKLLRVLETGAVQRVGGSTSLQTEVRVLSATNRDPEEAIRAGKLREDLYFRLAVFPIRLPPLREREGDVGLLAQHFLDLHNAANGTDKHWEGDAFDALARHPWRGNVRELRNAVQRAYILADDLLRVEHALGGTGPAAPRQDASGGVVVRVGTSIEDMERTLILATLESVGGDKSRAASQLGISLKTLYSRLSIYNAERR